jgi:hypothetical protein
VGVITGSGVVIGVVAAVAGMVVGIGVPFEGASVLQPHKKQRESAKRTIRITLNFFTICHQ